MTSEDQTDRIQQLEKRIEELENKQQLSKFSRRGLLAGVAGVAGVGAMSGSGAAASGQVGTANSRVNVFADDVNARSVTGNTLYAGAFSGASVDARLDSALNAASFNETIVLEPRSTGTYSNPRTINKRICLRGVGFRSSTRLEGDITFDGSVTLENLALRGNATVNAQASIIGCDIGDGTHTISDIDTAIIGCRGFGATIEFTSGSSDCTAVGNIGVNFVNNGTNIAITGNA